MLDHDARAKPGGRRWWLVVVAFVALGLLFFRTGHRLFDDNRWLDAPFETAPYDRHIDEYAWYHYTYHYHLLAHEHAFDHLAWGHDVPAIGQPNTYKIVLGRVLERYGVPINTDESLMREWWQPMSDDEAFKAYLKEHLWFSDRALMVGRFASAVFNYLTIVLCAVYLSRLAGLWAGVAGALFVGHLQLFEVTRMMSDSLLLLAFLVCFVLYDLIAGITWRVPRVVLIVAYSVVVGLTMGIKLTGFLALVFLPALYVLRCITQRTREACRDGSLWSLVHCGIALSVFVVLHPQTYDNPVVGVWRFFSHQAPVTVAGQNLALRAWGELVYQVGQLARNLGDLLLLERLGALWVLAIVVLLVAGFSSLVFGRDRLAKTERVLPLLTTIVASSVMLSHTLDERYTWLLTVVLSFVVVLGMQFLVDNLRILLAPSAPHETVS
jgi:hypothetical protein